MSVSFHGYSLVGFRYDLKTPQGVVLTIDVAPGDEEPAFVIHDPSDEMAVPTAQEAVIVMRFARWAMARLASDPDPGRVSEKADVRVIASSPSGEGAAAGEPKASVPEK